MKADYLLWIAKATAHLLPYDLRGRCVQFAKALAQVFPELKPTAGWAITRDGWREEHMWCETADGEVIDPTAAQFDEPFYYLHWQPGYVIRTGKCMNCGCDIFSAVQTLNPAFHPSRHMWCSDECCKALYESLKDT